jgi:hypothetical protein
MPSVARELPLDRTLYSKAELTEHRRNILRYARSFPPGYERNRHRQVALLFRALCKTRRGSTHILLRALAVTQGGNHEPKGCSFSTRANRIDEVRA